MKIEKNKYVSIHYTLTDAEGNQLDSSVESEPLGYVHGNGMLISGLEAELEGKEPGARFRAVIEPADAYGEYNENFVAEVPRSQFEDGAPIEIGMAFQAQSADGGYVIVHVINVTDDTVTIDGNHELAGKQLTFDVEVLDVRDATEEELNPSCGCCGGCGENCGDGDCGCENGCGGCSSCEDS